MKAEGFRRDIAKANEAAREAETQSAQASLELARFKAPRTLSPTQPAGIAARLRPLGPRRVDVIVIGDEQEIADIAMAIEAAVGQVGWSVHLVGRPSPDPTYQGTRGHAYRV